MERKIQNTLKGIKARFYVECVGGEQVGVTQPKSSSNYVCWGNNPPIFLEPFPAV